MFSCIYQHTTFLFYLQGHAAPVLYAAWAEAGFVKESDLLNLRKLDCDLEGHPTPVSQESWVTCLPSHFCINITHSLLSCLFCSTPETGVCRCGHRISGTGSWRCLWDGLYWQILRQIQVRMYITQYGFIINSVFFS